jgi:hypothetical protein
MLISYYNCYVFQHLKQHFLSQILRISSQHVFMWNIRSLPYINRFVMKNGFRTYTFNSHNTSLKIRYAHHPNLIFKKMLFHHQHVVKKVVKKYSKSCKKLSKKLSKSWQKVVPCIIGHFMCHRKPFKRKNQQRWWGVGGEIVVPRLSASASLTGRRQKDTYIRETWGPGVLYYVLCDFLQNLADTDTHFMFWKCCSI